MKRFTVNPTFRFYEDAVDVFGWINEQEPTAAIEWYEGLLNVLKTLAQQPARCSTAPESRLFSRDIRQLLYGNYRILFIIKVNSVEVLTVRHGARDHIKKEDFLDKN